MGVCFKVLDRKMKSIGLLGATKMQYKFGVWNRPLEPISDHPRKGGGLWVTPKLADARGMKKYVLRKHHIKTRIFICKIDKMIYKTSCRIKTDGVFLLEEIR